MVGEELQKLSQWIWENGEPFIVTGMITAGLIAIFGLRGELGLAVLAFVVSASLMALPFAANRVRNRA